MNSIIKIILLLYIIINPALLVAQENWENDGEIEDVQIEIVKDREITLPRANRNFDKVPPGSFDSQHPAVNYQFSNLDLPLPELSINVRPLRIKQPPLDKLYGNYVKAGFGNYSTPYFEGFVSNKRSRDYWYGAHVNFIRSASGPVGGKDSGSGKFDVAAFGKYFGNKVTVGGDLSFNRRSYNYYGYISGDNINTDTLGQHYNVIALKTSFENTNKSAKVNYLTQFKFDYLTDNYNAKESEVQIDFDGTYDLGENAGIHLKSNLNLISQEDAALATRTRNIFGVQPSFTFEYNGFLIDAGFRVVYENDTLGEADELHFFPAVRARYQLTEQFEVYAGIRGDVEKQTLRKFVSENPFLGPNTPVFNSYNTFELYGGISGALTSKLGFGAQLAIANYKNLYFFNNTSDDVSKFEVIYDTGNTAVVNLSAQMSYANSDVFRLTLQGDYWGYSTDKVNKAYHRPNYKISSLATLKLFDKFRIEGEVYAVGGITAFDPSSAQEVDLSTFLDINLGLEYLFSKQFSAFIRFNNILSNEYELLNRYPNRGLLVMGGVTYTF